MDFQPERAKRVMIPTVFMILTYEMKLLMGISPQGGSTEAIVQKLSNAKASEL